MSHKSQLRFEVEDGRVKVGDTKQMYVEDVDDDTTISYVDYQDTVFVDLDDLREKMYVRVVNSEDGTFVARIEEIGSNFVEYAIY